MYHKATELDRIIKLINKKVARPNHLEVGSKHHSSVY